MAFGGAVMIDVTQECRGLYGFHGPSMALITLIVLLYLMIVVIVIINYCRSVTQYATCSQSSST